MEALRPSSFADGIDSAAFCDAFALSSPEHRREHATIYNYWLSMRGQQRVPSIGDLDPLELGELNAKSILLEIVDDAGEAEIRFLGQFLRVKCVGAQSIKVISEAPPNSVLSLVTDKLSGIAASGVPIAFETELAAENGATLHAVTLLPWSMTESSVDFVYGLITSEDIAAVSDESVLELMTPFAETDPVQPLPGFSAEALGSLEGSGQFLDVVRTAAIGPSHTDEKLQAPICKVDDLQSLHQVLFNARTKAVAAEELGARSRAALYEALAEAFEFSIVAEADQDSYLRMVAEAGLTIQARAPMTPIVKLVFGMGYDKARVTEYAAALSLAHRQRLSKDAFLATLQETGLKALVQADRRDRGTERGAQKHEQRRFALKRVSPLASVAMDVPGNDEFVVLLARRDAPGMLSIVSALVDERLIDLAVRRTK